MDGLPSSIRTKIKRIDHALGQPHDWRTVSDDDEGHVRVRAFIEGRYVKLIFHNGTLRAIKSNGSPVDAYRRTPAWIAEWILAQEPRFHAPRGE